MARLRKIPPARATKIRQFAGAAPRLPRRAEKSEIREKTELTKENPCANITEQSRGGVAQLGERLTGSQEVNGSIPSVSTIAKALQDKTCGAFLFLPVLRGFGGVLTQVLTLLAGVERTVQSTGYILLPLHIQMSVYVRRHLDVRMP
jgi:hypothetical protein